MAGHVCVGSVRLRERPRQAFTEVLSNENIMLFPQATEPARKWRFLQKVKLANGPYTQLYFIAA